MSKCGELLEKYMGMYEVSKSTVDKTWAKAVSITSSPDVKNMALVHRGLRNDAETDTTISRKDPRYHADANQKRDVIQKFLKLRKPSPKIPSTEQGLKASKTFQDRTAELNANIDVDSDNLKLSNGNRNLDKCARNVIGASKKFVNVNDKKRGITDFNDEGGRKQALYRKETGFTSDKIMPWKK